MYQVCNAYFPHEHIENNQYLNVEREQLRKMSMHYSYVPTQYKIYN